MLRLSHVLSVLVLAGPAVSELLIGEFNTLQHDVSGKVYAKDENTLVIYNFKYDGNGPDAFFWVGKTGTPRNTDESQTYLLSEGANYAYDDFSAPILKGSSGKTVTLTLPQGWKMEDIKWLSVWCRKFSVDFGNIIVPEGFKAPVAGEPGSPAAEPEPEQEPEPIPDVDNDISKDAQAEPESEPESEPASEPLPGGSVALTAAPLLALAAALLVQI